MSRFRDRLRVIPTTAWVIAGLMILCMEIVLWQLGFQQDQEMMHSPFSIKLLLAALVAVCMGAYVLLVGYVSGDAKRRGMRQVMWTLIAIFVPNAMGIILYFFLREPLMATCPQCGTPAKSTFAFCHQCGAEICPACPQCRRPVEANWKACAYCGTDLANPVSAGMQPGNPASNPRPLA